MATMMEDVPVHLRGNGRPESVEHSLSNLTVKGSLPPELDGRYIRTGANPFTGYSDHPFAGDGMVHGIRIRDGKAEWYRNRFVQTPFITNPDINAADPAVMMDMTMSKANTHVMGHAGRLLVMEEAHFPYVIDGDMNTVGPLDFDGVLTSSFTAHPKIRPETGEMLAFGASVIPPHLRYYRISADGKMVHVEDITIGGPVMMHDFNITRNHVIFMDLPAVFDMQKAMTGDGMPIGWDENYPSRFGVMPRDGNDSQVKWFELNPCYVFHPMNSYEEGDKIILDVLRYDYVWRDSAIDMPPAALWRFTLDLTTGQSHEQQLDDVATEFPRVAESLVGLKHRYGYAMRLDDRDQIGDSISSRGGIRKYDCETGATADIDYGPGRTGGEPVFVPSANSKAEDDGYLMTYVYDENKDASEFVIMDAASMDNEPIATVDLPRIPNGFHGSWTDSSVAD